MKFFNLLIKLKHLITAFYFLIFLFINFYQVKQGEKIQILFYVKSIMFFLIK